MQAYRHPVHGELGAFTVGTGKVIFEFHGGQQKWLHNNMTVVEVRQDFKRSLAVSEGAADIAGDCSDASGPESAAESESGEESEGAAESEDAAESASVAESEGAAESESAEASEVEGSSGPTSTGQEVKPEQTSAPITVPPAMKRGATAGEASASGRTVQSGSGSSRLPFAQAQAVTNGLAGGSLLALGLAAL